MDKKEKVQPQGWLDPNQTDATSPGILASLFRDMINTTRLCSSLKRIADLAGRRIAEREATENKKITGSMAPKLIRDANSSGMSIKVFFDLITEVLCCYDIKISISFKTKYTGDKTYIVTKQIHVLNPTNKNGDMDEEKE